MVEAVTTVTLAGRNAAPISHVLSSALRSDSDEDDASGGGGRTAAKHLGAEHAEAVKQERIEEGERRREEFAVLLRNGRVEEKQRNSMPMVQVKGYEARSEMWRLASNNDLVIAWNIPVHNAASNAAGANSLANGVAYAVSEVTAQVVQLSAMLHFVRRIGDTQTYMSYISPKSQ